MLDQLTRIWTKYSFVYWKGLLGTLWLSAVTVFFATLLGTVLAVLKLSKFKPGQWLVDIYVEIIRGTPVLLQIYFFWIFLPKMASFELTDTQSIIIALVINASAYVCEIIRAGIQAVDIGQQEAGLSLGLTGFHTFTRIIFPQAIKNILPAIGNECIALLKETSVAGYVTIVDLTRAGNLIRNNTYDAVNPLLVVAIVYLVLVVLLTRLLAVFEKRLHRSDAR